MGYLPIEQYGIIGNMHTVALVGKNGSIDWWCFPHFDSPSIFAAILDEAKGGWFQIAPACEGIKQHQLYFPDTNVLITRFLAPDGVAELTDFMPVGSAGPNHDPHQIIRRMRMVRGRMPFHLECRPAFDYARMAHTLELPSGGAIFRIPDLTLGLATRIPIRSDRQDVVGGFTLNEGDCATFILRAVGPQEDCLHCWSEDETEQAFRETVHFWRKWLSQSHYRGRWREMVNRAALILKLLTFEPTGALVAAPTCSLPELIGGQRNWDYRYTWIRDAAFTLYGLMRIGFTDEARAFMGWLEARIHELEPDGSLRLMYGTDGRHELPEHTLEHLDGYRGSRPVRIGNAASRQFQLDIYGELMDSVYLFNKYGTPISYDLWTDLRRVLNWVVEHWHEADEGIWETRGGGSISCIRN